MTRNSAKNALSHLKASLRQSQASPDGLKQSLLNYVSSEKVPQSELKMLDNIIKSIGVKSPFSDREMLLILKSTSESLDVSIVRELEFIPRFHSLLEKSTSLDDKSQMEMFSLFLNLVILSEHSRTRSNFKVFVESFVTKHLALSEKVIGTSLEALLEKRVQDYENLLVLVKLTDWSRGNGLLLNEFIEQCEKLYVKSVDEDSRLLEVLGNIVSEASDCLVDLSQITALLKLAADTNLEKIGGILLGKVHQLNFDNLTDRQTNDLLFSMMRFGDPYNDITNLSIPLPQNDVQQTSFLQRMIFHNDKNAQEEIGKCNSSSLKLYNSLISSCAYSDKSTEYINSVTEAFKGMERDCVSYAILIEWKTAAHQTKAALQVFQKSIEDYVDWANEYDGYYMSVIYDMFEQYIQTSTPEEAFKVYQQIKLYNKQMHPKCLAELLETFFQNNLIGDAIELLDRELPNNPPMPKYEKVLHQIMQLVMSYDKDIEVNWTLYGYVHKYFNPSYETYLPAMKLFCEHQRPNAAYMIFHKMRNVAKRGLVTPPGEEIYRYLFQQFGRQNYEAGVVKLHLFMKMDSSINLNIHLLNAVLGGYCHLQDFLKARDVFQLALSLPKDRGINELTVSLMLQAMSCVSLRHTQQFWNNLSSYDYLPTLENYKQYLICHCEKGNFTGARMLLERWIEDSDFESREFASLLESCIEHVDNEEKANFLKIYSRHPQIPEKVSERNVSVSVVLT